jgi:hypothetical protein
MTDSGERGSTRRGFLHERWNLRPVIRDAMTGNITHTGEHRK